MTLRVIPAQGLAPPQSILLLVETLNQVVRGRANNTGTVTLAANETETVVEDNLFESSQVPLLIPTTANAALALTSVYLSAREKGAFTLTHDSTADEDRTFLYVRWG